MTTRTSYEVRSAARRLLRSPLFAGTAALILAVGIGSVTTIFTAVNGILLKPLPLEDGDEVLIVCENHPSLEGLCIGSPTTTQDLAERSTTLEHVGLARSWPFSISDAGSRISLSAGLVTPGFFDVFEIDPAAGRLFSPDEVGEDADVVLLGHDVWQTEYGADPDVVGRTLSLDGTPHTVVGVLPAEPELPVLDWIQLWRPLHFDPSAEERRSWRGFVVLARMRDGVELEDVRSDLEGLYTTLREESEHVTEEWRIEPRPLKAHVVGDVRPVLLAFIAAAGLLLVIACANVANLFLVRSARRSRELAVRSALGAGRRGLMGGVLAESFLLAVVGGAVGFGLAWLGTETFVALAPEGIPRLEDVHLDAWAFLFAFGSAGITAGLFGLIPAIRIGDVDLGGALRGSATGAVDGAQRTRATLVVAELALALTLLAGAGLLTRSFMEFAGWQPGFDRTGLAAMSVFFTAESRSDEGLVADLRRAEEVARTVPGVADAAFSSTIPLLGGMETIEYLPEGQETRPDGELPRARVFDVSPAYFETLGVGLLRGRPFLETDTEGAPPVLLVNETFAQRHWPGADPVGRRVTVPAGNWGDADVQYRIVGVARDVQPLTPGTRPEPEVYRTNRQLARPLPYLLIRSPRDELEAAGRVRESLLRSVHPDLSVNIRGTMQGLMDSRLVRPRFNMALIAAFAFAALVLTTVGVYGTVAYTAARRTREMGIRMALGSAPGGVTRIVLTGGIRMALAGVALGLLGSFAAGGLVSKVVYGVSPTDPLTLAGTALFVLLLAAGASLVPALRAGRSDPVELLRTE